MTPPAVHFKDITSPVKDAFEPKMVLFNGLKQRNFNNGQNPKQFRYYYEAWKNTSTRTNDIIFYEINDWNRNKAQEIRIDIQFWKEYNEICDIIERRMDNIGQKMPPHLKSQPYIDKKNLGWRRLQYHFNEDTAPEIVAESLKVLIQETKDIVNDWLISENKPHY